MKQRRADSIGFVRVAMVALIASATACMGMMGGGGGADLLTASAALRDTAGRSLGNINFSQLAGGGAVTLSGRLEGLSPGVHGIHLHTTGVCTGTGGFASAGGHYNPATMKHGLQASAGPHAGDLENITVAADGHADVSLTTARVTLSAGPLSLFDADGSALVVHQGPDDQMTDPSGGSGARIACGVVTKS